MKTEIISVKNKQNYELLDPAAKAIAEGALVAFPTETVYGLGASAFLPDAINKVFEVKGRPQDNPLIVHLAELDEIKKVAVEIPTIAYQILEQFSPGPLTVILKKGTIVPDEVTAGLDTVAIRFPENEIAKEFIRRAGVPIVAPSANISGKPSPTQAWHVEEDFDGIIPFIIDGGICDVGVESTIIDLTSDIPEILRPGIISAQDIYNKTGIQVKEYQKITDPNIKPKAPGQKYKHYSPMAKVIILETQDELGTRIEHFTKGLHEYLDKSQKDEVRIGLFLAKNFVDAIMEKKILDQINKDFSDKQIFFMISEYDSSNAAIDASHELFNQFRLFDKEQVDLIICSAEPEINQGIAYMNRLGKAADRRI